MRATAAASATRAGRMVWGIVGFNYAQKWHHAKRRWTAEPQSKKESGVKGARSQEAEFGGNTQREYRIREFRIQKFDARIESGRGVPPLVRGRCRRKDFGVSET